VGVVEKLPIYLENLPGGNLVCTSLASVVNWSRRSSLWYLPFGLACCAIELMATGCADYDFDRLGMMFRFTPRQTDLMIVAGTMTLKMGPRIKMIYDQMALPRYVVAVGGCTVYGGPFYYDSYSILKGLDKIVPVDVHIPGCPPRPEAIMQGCLMLRDKISNKKLNEI